MWREVPWTKTMLEDFIKEALLTEDEEKILRTRIAGWSIVKQALEFDMCATTISKHIGNIKEKYDRLHEIHPDRFVKRKRAIREKNVDNADATKEYNNIDFFSHFKSQCGRNPYDLTPEELIECQKTCPYQNFCKEE